MAGKLGERLGELGRRGMRWGAERLREARDLAIDQARAARDAAIERDNAIKTELSVAFQEYRPLLGKVSESFAATKLDELSHGGEESQNLLSLAQNIDNFLHPKPNVVVTQQQRDAQANVGGLVDRFVSSYGQHLVLQEAAILERNTPRLRLRHSLLREGLREGVGFAAGQVVEKLLENSPEYAQRSRRLAGDLVAEFGMPKWVLGNDGQWVQMADGFNLVSQHVWPILEPVLPKQFQLPRGTFNRNKLTPEQLEMLAEALYVVQFTRDPEGFKKVDRARAFYAAYNADHPASSTSPHPLPRLGAAS